MTFATAAILAQMSMPMSGPLGISIHREGSGTAWQPDAVTPHALHLMGDGWMLMIHGGAITGFDRQWSTRGGSKAFSTNQLMAMFTRDLDGGAAVRTHAMLSAEPWTVPKKGYPLLLQSGETYAGEPLHDTQHPHDLFMELSASLSAPVTDAVALEAYAGMPGEPALGPVAFAHRASAASPFSPLGHHWQDSTHVTFGVMTVAAFTRTAKVEASWFNGREPDENRLDFDVAPPDSWSGRVTVNPLRSLSAEISGGFLKSPEAHDPGTSEHRFVASISGAWSAPIGSLDATVIAARKILSGGEPASDSFLAEAVARRNRLEAFARIEHVTKSGHDLALAPPDDAQEHPITAGMLGAVVDAYRNEHASIGIGAQLNAGVIGSALEPYYGTRAPAGVAAFVRIRIGD